MRIAEWLKWNKDVLLGVLSVTLLIFGFILFAWKLYVSQVDNMIVSGIVIDKVYSPSKSSIGSGVNSNGETTTLINSSSEKYILIVDGVNRKGNKDVKSVQVKAKEYIKYDIGDIYKEEEH